MRPMARREMLYGWIFISPWVVGFLLFTAGPILLSIYYSFTAYNVFQPPTWIGLANYKTLLQDPLFWTALYNTLYYAGLNVPLTLAVSLAVAMLLNNRLPGINVFRTIYFLPSVLSGVAVALLWLWIFNPDYGLINVILGLLGIEGPLWLQSPEWAKPAIVIMSVWSMGGVMIINLAGLQNIPAQLCEAARIDGANAWQLFRHVIIPMLSPTLFFNMITLTIGSLQVFTQAYVMTQGGPVNSTLFYVYYLYKTAFVNLRMGYASALAWVLFAIIMAFTLIQVRQSRRWVYTEGD
ncbi:MAG TPA: sugar ABC transporter permease [Limnochordales bacterium]